MSPNPDTITFLDDRKLAPRRPQPPACDCCGAELPAGAFIATIGFARVQPDGELAPVKGTSTWLICTACRRPRVDRDCEHGRDEEASG